MRRSVRMRYFNHHGQVRPLYCLAGGVFLFFGAACRGNAAQCDIVIGGKANAVIVVPDNPLPVDSYAAQELQYHVEKATGAKLTIVADSQKPAGAPNAIYIGDCNETEQQNIHPNDLERNHFRVRTVGADLYLVGKDGPGSPIQDSTAGGSLFAVYTFLDTQMQVRWLWPGKLGEVIPHRESLSV